MLGDNWKKYADELLDMAEEKNFKFVQSHSPLGRPLVFDEEHEQFIADTKRSIEASAYLGIKNIVVHSGYAKGMSKEETFKQNLSFYQELLLYAEKYNINILTENFNKMCSKDYYWIDSAETIKELVDYINHPLLKVCWDAGHGNLQELPQDKAISLLGDDLVALHIQDNFGYSDDHLMPFLGTLNIDSLMHGLLDIGYKGYFTFEAGNTPLSANRRRKYEQDNRCINLPIKFRKQFEKILYDIGKYILTQYNCFEE